MSLFDELFGGVLGDSRPKSPNVAPESPAENGSTMRVIAQSPLSPALCDEKIAPDAPCPQKKNPTHTGGRALTEPTKQPFVGFGSAGTLVPVGKKLGDAPCPTCGSGSFWRGESDAWQCEGCTPPGDAHVRTWRNVAGGRVPKMPPAAVDWPADLNAMLRRVATFYEWSTTDRRDLVAWARRSPDSLAEARQFLEDEAAKLPTPGLSERRRVVLDRLNADPNLRVAWLCEDRDEDPVVLTLAIRGKGACELAIPRERFDALALPLLIERLAQTHEGAA